MLPTPDTHHVDPALVYEPAEDSFLLLDTLSSEPERQFLSSRFQNGPVPLAVEIGTGSGVVISFLTANAASIVGRTDLVSMGVDVNVHACIATRETVSKACRAETLKSVSAMFASAFLSDLYSPLRSKSVDILIFNPPYVPTDSKPSILGLSGEKRRQESAQQRFEEESRLLELSYAGGMDGMEVTNRFLTNLSDILSQNGVAYLLLCAQNRPHEVISLVENWSSHEKWVVDVAGSSGKTAGWEKLCVLRMYRASGL